MYRVHAPPSQDKLASLRDFLHGLGISLPPGDQVHPRDLDRVLRRFEGTPEAPLVNEVMLRSQSQAEYSPDNIGHFGLALPRYVHFTSPIRRYADLLVHRALIRGLRLGDGALASDEAARFADTALHITATERRAQLAERDAVDRYLAAYMADKVGANFAARISGVTRFGLFVTVAESGASGLVPSTKPASVFLSGKSLVDPICRGQLSVLRRWSETPRCPHDVLLQRYRRDSCDGSGNGRQRLAVCDCVRRRGEELPRRLEDLQIDATAERASGGVLVLCCV